jgi:glycosyltransferase involved in cell wall biosynthesis
VRPRGTSSTPLAEERADVLLIAQPNSDGHRLYYVRLIAERALARGNHVHLLLGGSTEPDGTAASSFDTFLADLIDQVTVERRDVVDLRTAREVANDIHATLTIFPDGDLLLLKVVCNRGWRGAGRLSLLVMREGLPPAVSLVQAFTNVLKRLVMRLARRLPGISLAVLRSQTDTRASAFTVAPDPVTMSATQSSIARARRDFNLDPDVYWFAIVGALSARKNIPTVVAALQETAGAKVGLLLAGRCDDETRSAVRDLEANSDPALIQLNVHNRILTDVEIDSVVSAVDCVVLAHSNEGPSGLLGKAAAAGTRIVASGAVSLKRDVQALPGLATWVPLEVSAMSLELARVAGTERGRPAITPGHDLFLNAIIG